eukprot:3658607-Amphidinium_carterae.1
MIVYASLSAPPSPSASLASKPSKVVGSRESIEMLQSFQFYIALGPQMAFLAHSCAIAEVIARIRSSSVKT